MKKIVYIVGMLFLVVSKSVYAALPSDWEIALSKKIVIENKYEGYELALDTFERSLTSDTTGDSWYFIFLIHYYRKDYDEDVNKYISMLEYSKEQGNELAFATLYIIYSKPYLISLVDIGSAKAIKDEYQRLIAEGTINSANDFDMAVSTANKLLGID